MKEQLEIHNPKNMDEVIKNSRLCYQQMKWKGYNNKKLIENKGKKQVNYSKGFKSSNFKGS